MGENLLSSENFRLYSDSSDMTLTGKYDEWCSEADLHEKLHFVVVTGKVVH